MTQRSRLEFLPIISPAYNRILLQAEVQWIEDLADAIDQLEEDQNGDPTAMG